MQEYDHSENNSKSHLTFRSLQSLQVIQVQSPPLNRCARSLDQQAKKVDDKRIEEERNTEIFISHLVIAGSLNGTLESFSPLKVATLTITSHPCARVRASPSKCIMMQCLRLNLKGNQVCQLIHKCITTSNAYVQLGTHAQRKQGKPERRVKIVNFSSLIEQNGARTPRVHVAARAKSMQLQYCLVLCLVEGAIYHS